MYKLVYFDSICYFLLPVTEHSVSPSSARYSDSGYSKNRPISVQFEPSSMSILEFPSQILSYHDGGYYDVWIVYYRITLFLELSRNMDHSFFEHDVLRLFSIHIN